MKVFLSNRIQNKKSYIMKRNANNITVGIKNPTPNNSGPLLNNKRKTSDYTKYALI